VTKLKSFITVCQSIDDQLHTLEAINLKEELGEASFKGLINTWLVAGTFKDATPEGATYLERRLFEIGKKLDAKLLWTIIGLL